MFDMEFADLEPLMSGDDVSSADFMDISDSLRGDAGVVDDLYRNLHQDAQQLLLMSQDDEFEQTTTAIVHHVSTPPPPPVISKKKAPCAQAHRKQTSYHRPTSRNAARERSRVKSLRCAFLDLQNSLPSVPPNTKLSKLDVLVLATTYIAHLMKVLDKPDDSLSHVHSGATYSATAVGYFDDDDAAAALCPEDVAKTSSTESRAHCIDRHQHRLHEKGYLHPVRKWPMRSRLYAGAMDEKRGSQF